MMNRSISSASLSSISYSDEGSTDTFSINISVPSTIKTTAARRKKLSQSKSRWRLTFGGTLPMIMILAFLAFFPIRYLNEFIQSNTIVSKSDARRYSESVRNNSAFNFTLSANLRNGLLTGLDRSTNTISQSTSSSPATSFRFCKSPVVDQLSTVDQPFKLLYQCSGQPYEDFSNRMIKFALEKSQASQHHARSSHRYQKKHPKSTNRVSNKNVTSTKHDTAEAAPWGQAKFPLPDNKMVLLYGNSHLRQVSKTIMCQYADVIHSYTVEDADTFSIRFFNNATWISITNTPLVYSKEWLPLLEYRLDGHIEQLDAIVLGKFNTYEEAKSTGFERTMNEQITMIREGQFNVEIDFGRFDPPNLTDVAEAFRGPILSVSMFAQQDERRARGVRRTIRSLRKDSQRTNLDYVDGRSYISSLGEECGSDDKLVMGTCREPGDLIPNSNRNPADMHRCTGSNGGHPDLVGWDIVEKLHTLLSAEP